MQDREVSLTGVAAIGLWGLGVALVTAQLITGVGVGQVGLLAGAGGATLTVRGYFVELAQRERNAFEIGRDMARESRTDP